ncbi:MAG: winged helix-turn-helix domain-containing protein [Bacillota bacterium]|uniref:LysR family transcriptional regulator n=1 Tax=Thermanaerosceptrum fracticalcis TaxID=1712410 RepID=A0A7G6E350_THEFR|nr:LysR family transcriptional regulator [Thermanaerosceptrum fracticalcis]QNB46504.1 LysR family transcriptional regulator [Thermanaerosceptrum fracticalcis]
MKLRYKLWLEVDEGKAFGTGPYEILKHVEVFGSLNKAAKELNISYSKAWKIINMVEERLGMALIHRETGGMSGGGSYLTEEGKNMLRKYSSFMEEADQALQQLFAKHFS